MKIRTKVVLRIRCWGMRRRTGKVKDLVLEYEEYDKGNAEGYMFQYEEEEC
jgi:hypothetical protein